MSELLIGVDLGTSGTSGVLARPDGEVLATAEKDHEVSMPKPGWVEHDAEEDWWYGFVAVCSELLESAGDDDSVTAVCVSGIAPTLLPADEDGRPLRPAILYGVDTRASEEVEEFTEKYGNGKIIEVCGNPLTAQSVGPKMVWLEHNEPEVWEETRYFLMSNTFVVHRLTGAYVLDHPSASMCEPIYNVEEHDWIRDWAEEVAPGLELPELLWPADVAGEITEAAAAATDLPAGIPVAVGTVDAFAEAISVGVRNPGDLMLMYGTTMTTLEITEEVLPSPNMFSTAGPFEGTNVLVGAMSTSGALTGWVKGLTGDASFEELTEEAREVTPGSDGLVVLPYFAGERTPISDPDARCDLWPHLEPRPRTSIPGHAGGHRFRGAAPPGSLARGRWQGRALRRPRRRDERRAVDPDRLRRHRRPQELPEQTICAAYGDALLAGIAGGLVETGTDWSTISEVVEPNPENREVYDELYEVYKDLYPATRPMAHTLAGMQTGGET